MNEIKDNISYNEIISNVKPRDIFESSIKKVIKRRKDKEPEENEKKIKDYYINIKKVNNQIITM